MIRGSRMPEPFLFFIPAKIRDMEFFVEAIRYCTKTKKFTFKVYNENGMSPFMKKDKEIKDDEDKKVPDYKKHLRIALTKEEKLQFEYDIQIRLMNYARKTGILRQLTKGKIK